MAANVVRIRRFRDLSQEHIAGRMAHHGWTQSTVSRVESGQRSLRVPELLDLASILEVEPALLYAERLDIKEG